MIDFARAVIEYDTLIHFELSHFQYFSQFKKKDHLYVFTNILAHIRPFKENYFRLSQSACN